MTECHSQGYFIFWIWGQVQLPRWLLWNSKPWSKSPCGSSMTVARWWFQLLFIFTFSWGEMIHFDEHVFQMGWNHQLGCDAVWKEGHVGTQTFTQAPESNDASRVLTRVFNSYHFSTDINLIDINWQLMVSGSWWECLSSLDKRAGFSNWVGQNHQLNQYLQYHLGMRTPLPRMSATKMKVFIYL